MGLIKSTIFFSAVAFSAMAFAQWQWVDKDGRKVFSDRPPPADVADKSILKRPAGGTPIPPIPSAAASSTASVAAPKISGVDPALEEKKKQADAVEAAKKKREADQLAKAQADNCLRATASKANFDSGMRIARINGQGEREILDDAARAAESKRLQDIMNSDCR